MTDASRSRRSEIRPRFRQQGHRRRRLRIAARSVFARDERHRVSQEAVSRRAERPHGLHRRDPGARRPRRDVDARRRGATATSRSCCRRSSITRTRRRGPTGCARAASRSGSSASPRRRCRELFADHCDFILNGEPEAGVMRLAQGDRSRRASSSASRSTTSIRCRSRAGISSPRIARGSSASSGRRGRSAAAIRCWPAAAARSSAPTARTGFSPATARGRSRTSSTRSSGCAISVPRPYVIFRDPLFTEQRDRVPRAVRRDQGARPEADVRGRDAARSPRRRAARQAVRRRASAR